MEKPFNIQLALSDQMILDTVAEYEREHPGTDGWKMPPEEFGRRMMAKVKASMQIIEGGNA